VTLISGFADISFLQLVLVAGVALFAAVITGGAVMISAAVRQLW
jgi:hypothetical protein